MIYSYKSKYSGNNRRKRKRIWCGLAPDLSQAGPSNGRARGRLGFEIPSAAHGQPMVHLCMRRTAGSATNTAHPIGDQQLLGVVQLAMQSEVLRNPRNGGTPPAHFEARLRLDLGKRDLLR